VSAPRQVWRQLGVSPHRKFEHLVVWGSEHCVFVMFSQTCYIAGAVNKLKQHIPKRDLHICYISGALNTLKQRIL